MSSAWLACRMRHDNKVHVISVEAFLYFDLQGRSLNLYYNSIDLVENLINLGNIMDIEDDINHIIKISLSSLLPIFDSFEEAAEKAFYGLFSVERFFCFDGKEWVISSRSDSMALKDCHYCNR